jgi:hypothetical protein
VEVLSTSTSSAQTRATAFVEEIRPGFVTVRLNFVESEHTSSQQGQTTDRDTADSRSQGLSGGVRQDGRCDLHTFGNALSAFAS